MSNQQHVVTVQPTMMAPNMPNQPANWNCPSCHRSIQTKVDYKATTKTHMLALGMCVCCCWICAWIPYVTNSCRAANHTCPECHQFIGVSNN